MNTMNTMNISDLKKKAWLWTECSSKTNDLEPLCQIVKDVKFGKIISIEGNIGSGKSTAIAAVPPIKKSKCGSIYVQSEPVEAWGEWLGLFYSDMKRWALGFQMKILKSYYDILLDIQSCDNLIIERTPYTAWNIFSEGSSNLEKFELDLLHEYMDAIGWQPDYWLYLQCPPEVSYKRIGMRGRDEEKSVDPEYIKFLHEKHERVFNPHSIIAGDNEIIYYVHKKLFIISSNQSIDIIAKMSKLVIETIIYSESLSALNSLGPYKLKVID